MQFELVHSAPEEMDEVARFLGTVFRTDLDAQFLEPALLAWKYHASRPDWVGGRSVGLKSGERIAAHAGIWPVTFVTERGEVRGVHLIDWAGSEQAPGAGVLLLRKLLEHEPAAFLLTIGGSAATQAILPRIGYRASSHAEIFARVLRPWRQYELNPVKDWKAPLRLARNIARQPAPSRRHGAPWSFAGVERFDSDLGPLLQNARLPGVLTPRRTAELLNYLLACPGATIRGFLLYQGDRLRGYFVLSRVQAQTRIADLFVDSSSPEDWGAAVAAAVACAHQDPETCEISAMASMPLIRDGLVQCGFSLRASQPVFVLDPEETLSGSSSLYLQMMDGDAAFLAHPAAPFLM